ADEEIGAARAGDEVVGPRGIPRVDDGPAGHRDAVAERGQLRRVRDDERQDADGTDRLLALRGELLELEREGQRIVGGLVVEGAEEDAYAALDAPWPVHHEAPR